MGGHPRTPFGVARLAVAGLRPLGHLSHGMSKRCERYHETGHLSSRPLGAAPYGSRMGCASFLVGFLSSRAALDMAGPNVMTNAAMALPASVLANTSA